MAALGRGAIKRWWSGTDGGAVAGSEWRDCRRARAKTGKGRAVPGAYRAEGAVSPESRPEAEIPAFFAHVFRGVVASSDPTKKKVG
jgi:hypothetical protein